MDNNLNLELSEELGSLTSLEFLSLENIGLRKMPDFVEKLQHLQQIDLSANELSELSPKIGQLKELEVLRLNYNQINQIPHEITQLQKELTTKLIRQIVIHLQRSGQRNALQSNLRSMNIFNTCQCCLRNRFSHL